ncbi:MAG: hypothetical protein GXP29_09155 [Planctomycetes bacterium]|nr:hypothetical protein [Planctomycetota bacterium]
MSKGTDPVDTNYPTPNRRLLFVLMMVGSLAGAVLLFDTGCDGTVFLPGANPASPTGGVRGSNRTPTPSSTPEPSPTPDVVECTDDVQCNDGVFCNGEEVCNNGSCANSAAPCDLQTETCNEDTNLCEEEEDVMGLSCFSDVNCPQGQACDSVAGECVPLVGCGRGACNIANSSPGCNNQQCCDDVCLFDPACCTIQWTESCADRAFSISTCLVP